LFDVCGQLWTAAWVPQTYENRFQEEEVFDFIIFDQFWEAKWVPKTCESRSWGVWEVFERCLTMMWGVVVGLEASWERLGRVWFRFEQDFNSISGQFWSWLG